MEHLEQCLGHGICLISIDYHCMGGHDEMSPRPHTHKRPAQDSRKPNLPVLAHNLFCSFILFSNYLLRLSTCQVIAKYREYRCGNKLFSPCPCELTVQAVCPFMDSLSLRCPATSDVLCCRAVAHRKASGMIPHCSLFNQAPLGHPWFISHLDSRISHSPKS